MSPTPLSRPDISPELALVDPELRRVARLLLPDPGSLGGGAKARPVSTTEQPQRREAAVGRRSPRRVWARRALVATSAAAALIVPWPSAVGLRAPEPTLLSIDSSAFATRGTERPPAERSPRAKRGIEPASVRSAAAVRQRQSTAGSPAAHASRPARRPIRTTQAPRPVPRKPRLAGSRARPEKVTSRPSPLGLPVVRKSRHDRLTLSWAAVAGASYYNLIVWRNGRRVLDLWPSVNRTLLPTSWTHEGTSRTLAPGRYLWFVYPGFGARAEARYGEPVQSGILVIDRK
jgi:hypothetical protein